MYQKKYKLPKKYWVKGMSKFLFIRLEEDPGFINPYTNKSSLITVGQEIEGFWKRLLNWFLKLLK